MSYEIKNNRILLESLAMRQRELTESNAKILDWAMKTISSKKKIPLPQIRISDYRPYTTVPQGVTDPPYPILTQIQLEHALLHHVQKQEKNENHTIGKKELTIVEEVEEYLRMEAAKERATRNKK